MGLLRRPSLDTNLWHRVLTGGSYEDFQVIYRRKHANADLGRSPLHLALTNSDPRARVAMSTRLLEDGARADQSHPLHILLCRNPNDPVPEAALLQKLIDAGYSVNDRTDDGMTPLEEVAARFKFSDATLTPYYDVLLARPEIDLLGPGLDGRPVLTNLRKWYAKRGLLVERVEALLVERGLPVPGPGS